MNHIRRIGIDGGLPFTALKVCHPERSLAASKASGQTQSKDPYLHDAVGMNPAGFRIAVRFFDDHDTEFLHDPSREAAIECSPRRKPWVGSVK